MMRLLRNIGQLATCPVDNPQADAGLLDGAAVLMENGRIAWVGREPDLPSLPEGVAVHDCDGGLVVPGLVDCHTHLCFGGWRGDEFAARLDGASYQEIAAEGGGILRTVRQTRETPETALFDRSRGFLDAMLTLGVTTVEAKSGYGLDLEHELRQLRVYRRLNEEHPVDVVPTVLGAHALPPEFTDDRGGYLDLLCDELLPRVAEEGLARFCDAFVEQGAFTLAEGRRVLERARSLGIGLKLHADQLSAGGGAALAAELGAVSAEHLEYADAAGIEALADAGTVAVSLPLASLYLGEPYLDARAFLAAGVPVAVATDFNPGSAPSYHLPLALTLACLQQHMTPQEALMGATMVAARALGEAGRIGSVAPGFDADLAVLDAPDLNHWLYHFRPDACREVFKTGWPLAATLTAAG